jgi:hypothetical protein
MNNELIELRISILVSVILIIYNLFSSLKYTILL